MPSIIFHEVNKQLVGLSERDSLKKKFSAWLKAFRNKDANVLRTSDVFYIWRMLEQFGIDMTESFVHLEERYGTFIVGVSSPNLQAWFCLRALLSSAHINNTKAGAILMHDQTALLFAESETFLSNFVNCLDFDDDDRVKGSIGPLFLNYLVECNEVTMLRLLLERNVNIDSFENHLSPFHLACRIGNEEVVAMFIYYNAVANPSLLEDEDGVYKQLPAIFLAAEMGHENIFRMLIDYTYDQWNDFDLDVLAHKMVIDSPSYFQELDCIARKCPPTAIFWTPECTAIWKELFSMRSSYLEGILYYYSQSEDAFNDLIECFQYTDWEGFWRHRNLINESERTNFFANLYILASTTVSDVEAADENRPKLTFLAAMMTKIHDELPLRVVMTAFFYYLTPSTTSLSQITEEMESIIFLLLANNAPMDNFTFQLIYDISDHWRTKFFEICRFQEVDCSQEMPDWYSRIVDTFHVSSFYCNFPRCKTIMDVLRNPANEIHDRDIAYFTSLSSHPAVKEKAYSMEKPELTAKIESQPNFPTLEEFARDAARKYVVKQHNVKTNWQFYEAVKALEIPRHLKKIIAYEKNTPLY